MPSNADPFHSEFQKYIYISRYSRYLLDQNRREVWPETISRYFDFFTLFLKENNGFKLSADLRKQLESAILSMRIMPSMRCLMTAGMALEKENIGGFNCLAYETKILTKEYGSVAIGSLEGKDVSVMSPEGTWVKTTVKSYGKQSLQKVSFRYTGYNGKEEVFATPDHDWVTDYDTRVKTKNLRKGMKIPYVALRRRRYDDIDYRLGVIHGLVYGDGTQQKYKEHTNKNVISQERTKGYMIRLCSDQEDLLTWFEGYTKSYPKSADGDPIVYLYDNFAKTHALKELPNEDESESYMVGFFRGWLAADGHVAKNSQEVSICIGSVEETWLRRVMPKFGFYFSGSYELPKITSYGERKKDSRILKLWRYSLVKEDFLIKRKRDNFIPMTMERTVIEVQETDRYETVYCVEVPIYRSFVIERGILTGNCSYVAIDNPKSFAEILYILMQGTGVGFSVERQYVNKLPEVPEELHPTDTTIVVRDSKLGWANALQELISLLYTGLIPKWDMSKVRPAGSILRTFGGRASGPEPLERLFRFVVQIFQNNKGQRLTSLDCHEIACMIGECIVVGGVRRSALISLSNLSDTRMRNAKTGQWWSQKPWLSLSNNSAVYTDKRPPMAVFMDEWKSLYDSKSGERGIFSRWAAKNVIQRANDFRKENFGDVEGIRFRDVEYEGFGCNPCSEIILRDKEFCNLSEVVVRHDDVLETLIEKVKLATILGTFQSTLTNFRFLSSKWKKNTEEERLLGVSLTGIVDNVVMAGKESFSTLTSWLTTMRKTAIATNLEFAKKLGIEPSVAITCVKPSGTVSALTDTASGIHARHAPYYIRTVRSDKKDPLAQLMIEQGVPVEDDKMRPDHNYVFSFPMKSPERAIFRNDMNAISQLDLWLTYQKYWAEHKPSITISVKEDEWFRVGSWVYDNFEWMSGVSFLPYSDHAYQQAPFQDITKDQYEQTLDKFPKNIDWNRLSEYEKEDQTTGSQELACSAGCEIR